MKLCDYQITSKTTASGKALFECSACKHRSPAPTKKRCGLCAACGFHFGTIGHTLNCSELDDDERSVLAKLADLGRGRE